MADPTQFSFDIKEVTEALIKQQGLTSGSWTLSVEFNFTALATGLNPQDVKPSMLIQVSRLQLLQAAPGTVGTIVDAAKLTSGGKPGQKRKG
jgi:hypothetical protein